MKLDRIATILLGIILCGHLRMSHGALPVAVRCFSGSCFVLYDSDPENSFTWDESKTTCEDFGQKFASLPDDQTQTEVADFVTDTVSQLGLRFFRGAWIAGKRRPIDGVWQYLNGSKIDDSLIQDNDELRHCGRLTTGREPATFVADLCTTQDNEALTVCEAPARRGGGNNRRCGGGDIDRSLIITQQDDVCYYVGLPNVFMSWYDGQTFCRSRYGGDLAYSGVLGPEIIQELDSRELLRVWTGAVTAPWEWHSDAQASLIRSFNWEPGFSETTDEDRVYMMQDSTWRRAKNDTRLRYFLCSFALSVVITSTTPSVTSPAETTTTMSTVSTDQRPLTETRSSTTTSTPDEDEGSISSGALAGIIILVIIVVILLVVILILALRVKRNAQYRPGSKRETAPGLETGRSRVSEQPSLVSVTSSKPEYEDVDARFKSSARVPPPSGDPPRLSEAGYEPYHTYANQRTKPSVYDHMMY